MKDHSFAFSQPLERSREHNIPHAVAFVDFENKFSSVKLSAVPVPEPLKD